MGTPGHQRLPRPRVASALRKLKLPASGIAYGRACRTAGRLFGRLERSIDDVRIMRPVSSALSALMRLTFFLLVVSAVITTACSTRQGSPMSGEIVGRGISNAQEGAVFSCDTGMVALLAATEESSQVVARLRKFASHEVDQAIATLRNHASLTTTCTERDGYRFPSVPPGTWLLVLQATRISESDSREPLFMARSVATQTGHTTLVSFDEEPRIVESR